MQIPASDILSTSRLGKIFSNTTADYAPKNSATRYIATVGLDVHQKSVCHNCH
jgi:hypothetical protein